MPEPRRPIWLNPDGRSIGVIDQTHLPHEYVTVDLRTLDDAAGAIESMQVRGAPLIGVVAAFGLAFAAAADPSDAGLANAAGVLQATRPTAVNLRHAVDDLATRLQALPPADRAAAALRRATEMADEDVAINAAIGRAGLPLIERVAGTKDTPVQIMTHCNAGWLATVGWGTATAPIYLAHDAGIPIHVWVSETRPRNQGAALTAWELGEAGVPHTLIADNTAGHLLQTGRVDLCIVGTDRTLPTGDVANKIGTYLKALAANDNGVPFYAAVPSPSIDWACRDPAAIPIEERSPQEVTTIQGRGSDGAVMTVRLTPESTPAVNYGFDVTPARLLTGLLTERGLCAASPDGLRGVFPERFADA